MNIQGFSPAFSAPLQAQAATTNTNATKSTSATNAASSSSNDSSSNALSSNSLETTFLNLLVTELQNQDPTQPVDPTEMVSQMVSLNSLDQLISINQTLSNMSGGTSEATQATGSASVQGANAALSNPTAANAALSGAAAAGQVQPAVVPGGLMNLYGNLGTQNSNTSVSGGR